MKSYIHVVLKFILGISTVWCSVNSCAAGTSDGVLGVSADSAKSVPEFNLKSPEQGWAYYGRLSGGSANPWSEVFFSNETDKAGDYPKEKDVVAAVSSVNMRIGYMTYSASTGWYNQPYKRLIHPGQKFKVLEIHPILHDFIWVRLEPFHGYVKHGRRSTLR